MEQLYTWGGVNRDPRTRVISASYMALVDSSSLSVKSGNDEEDARWFNVDYVILQQKKAAAENGYIYEQIAEIKLWTDSENLTSKIKITENPDGRINREQPNQIAALYFSITLYFHQLSP